VRSCYRDYCMRYCMIWFLYCGRSTATQGLPPIGTYGYCDQNAPRAVELFNDADNMHSFNACCIQAELIMLSSICSKIVNQLNTYCVPDHNDKELIQKTSNLNNCHFLTRLLIQRLLLVTSLQLLSPNYYVLSIFMLCNRVCFIERVCGCQATLLNEL